MPAAGLLAAMALVMSLGCANSSPFNQKFVEVRTPNFHVTSSLGDRWTRILVRDLEVFHAGVLAAIGAAPDATLQRRTRVIAFDGRGVSRPFAIRGAGASLIPAVDGPIILIRAIGGFRQRVDPDLRHRYAHRILRDLSKAPLPLWYEEGRAQLAGTIEQSEDVVVVGRSNAKFRRLLLDWREGDLTTAMRQHSLADDSDQDRLAFEARSWAIVHTLLFDTASRRAGVGALDAVRAAAESGNPERLQTAIRALGSSDALTTRIYAQLERDKHRVDRFQVVGLVLADIELAKVPPAVARDRLAGLALELERPGLAEEYFERALLDRSDYPPALAGLALTDALEGRVDRTEERVARVAAAADGNAVAASRLGLALTTLAAGMSAGDEQTDRLNEARVFFERSQKLEPGRVEAQVGLGSSFLVGEGDFEQAQSWFEGAQRARPGALELELWLARVQLGLGRTRAARYHVEEVLSRSHSRILRKSARALLKEIEEQRGR